MSVKNPYKKSKVNEFQERMWQNRSTIYNYFKECGLLIRPMEINKKKYTVFLPPYKWDTIYLTVDNIRFTDFNALVLFTNELVVKYNGVYNREQVNIPYKSIETIQIDNELDIRYEELYLNK